MTTAKSSRRVRSDSAAAAVRAAQNAALPDLQPPDYQKITEDAKPYFADIVRARARDDWREVDLVVAAQLADCMAAIAVEKSILATEGRVLENARGTPVANPRFAVVEQLARQQMALMRTLQMGGRVAGDPRDKAKAQKLEATSRKIRAEIAEAEEDPLLAD